MIFLGPLSTILTYWGSKNEILVETPNDLQLQSPTWSSYKHHNTAKFIVGCTPNGAISFISPLYADSISDVELTRVSKLIEKLEGKSNICTGRSWFYYQWSGEGCWNTFEYSTLHGRPSTVTCCWSVRGSKDSICMYTCWAGIARVKNFTILKGSLPFRFSRIANQRVCVCCWLVNFQPVLIPPQADSEDVDVDEYFQTYNSSDSDYDADSELSEDD